MVNTKNEHVFPKDGGWIVRREGTKETFKFFENKEDSMEYARKMAIKNCSLVVTHKYNGQFKDFKKGNEIYVKTDKKIPRIKETPEIIHPIVNNTSSVVETITSI